MRPLRKETPDDAEMFLTLKRLSGRTGSTVVLSICMNAAKRIAEPPKKAASSQESQGYVEPPLRNPRSRSAIQPASVGIPSQSSLGLIRLLDSERPAKRSIIEAMPSGRLM